MTSSKWRGSLIPPPPSAPPLGEDKSSDNAPPPAMQSSGVGGGRGGISEEDEASSDEGEDLLAMGEAEVAFGGSSSSGPGAEDREWGGSGHQELHVSWKLDLAPRSKRHDSLANSLTGSINDLLASEENIKATSVSKRRRSEGSLPAAGCRETPWMVYGASS
jgi:hypothetical protein